MTINLKSPINRMGGKFFLRDWLVQYIPQHTLYCEVFGGAGHVLFGKSPSKVEVLNDIDSHLINFFQVIKDQEKRQRLIDTLQYMPYSRQLWQEMRDKIRGQDVITVITSHKLRQKSYKRQLVEARLKECPGISDRQIAKSLGVSQPFVSNIRKKLERDGDVITVITSLDTFGRKQQRNRSYTTDVQKAAEWYYLNRTCFGGDMRSGGFALPSVTGRNPAQSYTNSIATFNDIAVRLQGVTIENLSYQECIQKYDSKDTLFFCDPPYLNAEDYYGKKNFALEDHRDLANMLNVVKGKVMITHYQNDLYDELYRDWQKYEYSSFKGSYKSDGEEKPKTTEVLYCNFEPPVRTRNLFEGVN